MITKAMLASEDIFEKKVKADPVKFATTSHSLGFDLKEETQDSLTFDKTEGKIKVQKTKLRSFGPINFQLYYFDESAKKKYNREYKNDETRIDGVKIYRDGLITTPFAEFEASRDKKRDILGIDKRLWSGFLDKISTREIIGIVDISKERNPRIVDATNRQDFDDKKEYRDLKAFIIDQLNVLAEFKKFSRTKESIKINQALFEAKTNVGSFEKSLKNLQDQNPELKEFIQPLKTQAKLINKSIQRGLKQQEREKKEYIRKENIYLSLMSLQEYAVHVSHAVRTSLGKVKRMGEFFRDNFPNSKYENLFREYAGQIYTEMKNLSRVIDFMLSYAASNVDFEDIEVKHLI